jgi:hypothetical protein
MIIDINVIKKLVKKVNDIKIKEKYFLMHEKDIF